MGGEGDAPAHPIFIFLKKKPAETKHPPNGSVCYDPQTGTRGLRKVWPLSKLHQLPGGRQGRHVH